MAQDPKDPRVKEYYHEQRLHETGSGSGSGIGHQIYDKLVREGVTGTDPRLSSQGQRQDLAMSQGRVGMEGAGPAPHAQQAGGAPGGFPSAEGPGGAVARDNMSFALMGPMAAQLGLDRNTMAGPAAGMITGAQDLLASGAEMGMGGRAVAAGIAGLKGLMAKVAERYGPKAAQEIAEAVSKDVGDHAEQVTQAAAPKGASQGPKPGSVKHTMAQGQDMRVTTGKTPGGRTAVVKEKAAGGGYPKQGTQTQVVKTKSGETAINQSSSKTTPANAKFRQPTKTTADDTQKAKWNAANEKGKATRATPEHQAGMKQRAATRVEMARAKWREANPGKPDPESWSAGKTAAKEVNKAAGGGKTTVKAGSKKAVAGEVGKPATKAAPEKAAAGASKSAEAPHEAKQATPAKSPPYKTISKEQDKVDAAKTKAARKTAAAKKTAAQVRGSSNAAKPDEAKAPSNEDRERMQKRRMVAQEHEMPNIVEKMMKKVYPDRDIETSKKAWADMSPDKRYQQLTKLSQKYKSASP